MTSSRCAHAWALTALATGVTPFWLSACSSSTEPATEPNSTSTVATSTSGATSTSNSAGPTSGATTGGAANAATTVSASTSTTSPATTGSSATTSSATTGADAGGTTGATTATTGLGGSGGAGSTTEGTSTTGATTGSTGGPTGTPEASAGCGSPLPADTCTDSPCTLNGLDYFIDAPDDYDQNQPYPVVFQYHPLGGSAQQARTMYRVRPNFPDAIYVSPTGSNNGFPNTGGVDEDMTRAIIADIEAKFCIDKARYFATGFSYGGSMSYTAGFCIGDIFRAIAPMAGATISGANSCDPARPMAAWINHGSDDTALPISMSITLRDRLLETNGCSQETLPVDPSPCVEYQGCQAGYPIIWCEQPGVGHAIPDYGATTIAEFFQQF